MEIPSCNYKYQNNEYYVKSIKNDNYVPYVFGFTMSISALGLLISIYNANVEYKQEMTSKIKIVLHMILIFIFLVLLGYSGYEIGMYSTKDLSTLFTPSELLIPCYSKYSKKIYGASSINMILQEESGLRFYSYNDTITNSVNTNQMKPNDSKTIAVVTPFNTRTSTSTSTINGNATPGTASINSNANSTSSLGNRVLITNNSAPSTSTIGTTNTQQLSQNETGAKEDRILGTIEDGGSLIVRGP
jgi:hypothetical protein